MKVLELRNWIHTATAAENRARAAFRSLLAAESSMIRRCFRLERSSRRLFDHARNGRRRSPAGTALPLEWERQRLARELHTGVGQALAAIRLQLDILEMHLCKPAPAVASALSRISTLAEEALSEVRSVSGRLHPPEWQRLGLEDALHRLWGNAGGGQAFEGSLRIEPLAGEPDFDVKVLMYRSMQEAISNVMRHSGATRVEVTLSTRGSSLVLTIQDNGVGFDTARSHRASAGLGLRAIRDHAEAVGGALYVESGPSGTKLEIVAPIEPLPVGDMRGLCQ